MTTGDPGVTTPHVLNGAFERAIRAREHLVDLGQRLGPLQKHNDVVSIDPAAGLKSLTIEPSLPIVIPASMRIPILIGEVCYNLRSALDYLVFELAKHDSGSPQKRTQFPIECSEKNFRERRKKSLKGINDAHVTRIEELQPYKGCDWTKTLKDISNPDKHRELIKLKGEVIAIVYVFGEDVEFDVLPLPIQRAQHPISGAEVNIKVNASMMLCLSDKTPVMAALEEIIVKVTETLKAFKLEF
jgi:hypothetical protein